MTRRTFDVAQEETAGIHLGLLLARVLTAPLPDGSCPRLRTRLLRAAGIQIGPRTITLGHILVNGGREARANLRIGDRCVINAGCRFDATAPIELADAVGLGFDVLMTTSRHDASYGEQRVGALVPQPIRVETGAWIASRAVILPGVTIGAGAVVLPGAVVHRSVAPHMLVGGVPAREISALPLG